MGGGPSGGAPLPPPIIGAVGVRIDGKVFGIEAVPTGGAREAERNIGPEGGASMEATEGPMGGGPSGGALVIAGAIEKRD